MYVVDLTAQVNFQQTGKPRGKCVCVYHGGCDTGQMNDHSLLKSYGKHCDLWSVSLPLKCQFWQAGRWCSVICKCVSKWDVLISPALWHTVENLLIITTLPQTPVSSTHTTTSGLSSLQFHLQNETRNVCLTNQYILTIELVINKINNITLYLEYYIININVMYEKT